MNFLLRPAALALLTFVAWNLVQEFALSAELRYLRGGDRFVWNHKIHELRAGRLESYELYILGDSQTMSGIRPELLRKSSYNLALPSQQPEGMRSLAEYLPQAGGGVSNAGRPIVLININPFNLFESEVRRSFRHYYGQELLRYDLAGVAARSPGLVGTSAGDWLHQVLLFVPAYRANYVLGPLIGLGEAGLSDFPLSELRRKPELIPAADYEEYLRAAPGPFAEIAQRRERNRRLEDRLRSDGGFWIWKDYGAAGPGSDRRSSYNYEDCPARPDLDTAASPGFYVYPDRPASAAAYHDLFDFLLKKGYRIVIVQLPFSPGYGGIVNEAAVYAMLDRRLAELTADRPEIQVLPRPPADTIRATGGYSDLTHLSACGATDLTEWLRDRLP